MNYIVIGNDALLCRLLNQRFEYESDELRLEIIQNNILVVRGDSYEMVQCIKNEYADFPRTLVWQTSSIHASAASFLLSWAERFSKQDRNLVIHVQEPIPASAALSSRFRIYAEPPKPRSKEYRLRSHWIRRRDDYVRTFFHRSKIE